ncbi:MAG: hypothetical protein L0Y68_07890 [Candidatus Dadabacteria bacterium]|nr:hypothetical protein [Candidatus Dadabacteria bacterium]
MEKESVNRRLILSLIVILIYFIGCNDNPFDENPIDEGPEDEPDFNAAAAGRHGDVFIQITAERDSRDVDGGGILIIGDDMNGEQFDIVVVDGMLPTDFDGEPPIPQSDDLSGDFVLCTPAFAEFIVQVEGQVTTLRLNECEDSNSEMFEENGVIINPCTGEEVIDIGQFNGVCIAEEFGGNTFQDTIVLNEFDGRCTADDPCVVPIDVGIIVPAFQQFGVP